MKPVMQTKFGAPHGNCFSACVASILEIPLESIPPDLITRPQWFRDLNRWLAEAGHPWRMHFTREWVPSTIEGVYSIASGRSARGLMHAVVHLGEEMVHDPHPDGTGIDEVEHRYFFIPTNPAALLWRLS